MKKKILLILCALLAVLPLSASAQSEIAGSAEAIISNANAYCSESALGDVVADALRIEAEADLAVVFSGDLALYLMSGDLTQADVAASIPQNTAYVLAALTPSELKALLESGVGNIILNEQESIDYQQSECDNFPQVSGFFIRCDASAPIGERILSITLEDGTTLDMADTEAPLSVIVPASALTPEQAASAKDCGGIQDIFLHYLTQNSPLKKPSLNRIQIIGAHANPLISSGPVLMVGLIMIVCAVMAIPSILRRQKNPDARESVYFTGISNLRNKNLKK